MHCQPAGASTLRRMQVVPSAWLRLFNPKEVNELLSGGEGGGVDAQDMQRHATYSGGYSADSQTIRLFWKVGSPSLLSFDKIKIGKLSYSQQFVLPFKRRHVHCRWLQT